MEKLTLVVSLETNDEQVADVHQVEDGRWMVTTTYPIPRADLTRMLMAAGALVPTLPAADDAATHARMANLERWHNEDVASLCALRKEVETLGGRLKGTETACEVLRSERDELRKEAKDLKGALDMERAGAAALLSEAGAKPGETLRDVVLRLKQERDEAKRACDVATAQNERLRTSNDNMLHALGDRMEERNTARQDVERLTGELVKLSDALNEEHDKRLTSEAPLERIRNRCTPTLTKMLEGTHVRNPLDGHMLDWMWTDDRTGTVVLLKRDA